MRPGLVGVFALLCVAQACAQADYPGAIWNPAHSGNQTASDRPITYPFNWVVIHITEGSYAGAISWFQNDASNVSAHFVLRSSDGQATQMVRFKDIAWHAGNWTYNTKSIGIEHEGFADSASWWTDNLYRSSTNITRYITRLYNIPRDRTHIIMHREVEGVTKPCPGYFFNPDHYMDLLWLDATFDSSSWPSRAAPRRMIPVTIRFKNTGDTTWQQSGTGRVQLITQSGNASIFQAPLWDAPERPATVAADTATNGIGEFKFLMLSPTRSGVYTETFQMIRGDGNRFGPTVTVTTTIGAPDVIIDNTSADVTYTGSWSTGNTAAGRYGADYRFANVVAGGTPTAVASYFLNAPAPGMYTVSVWYPAGTNRSTESPFTVEHQGGSTVVRVDQQVNGGTWVYLGTFELAKGGGVVRLGNNASTGSVVLADAVKLSSANGIR